MPLHLDYRPDKFDEVVGNKVTVETIKNKVRGEDPPHAILLHGPKGCGKTTLARIISTELGCKIDSVDFVELDAVQCGKIETAREIREVMNFLPSEAECRIWLIDEAHGSSTKFQEGLLKALEDTPKHVFFILCTTNLGKIIGTVKSRCMKFEVKPLTDKQTKGLLYKVLKGENVEIEDENVIDGLVNAADGCPREALVGLDQIIDLDADQMLEAIQQTEAEAEVKELCQAMLNDLSWGRLAKILKGLKGKEPERMRQGIMGYMRVVVLSNSDKADRAALVYDCFREPVFYTGLNGIVFAAHATTL